MSSAAFSPDELNQVYNWMQELNQVITECESVFLEYLESRKGDPSRSQSSWSSIKSAATKKAESERECKEAAIRVAAEKREIERNLALLTERSNLKVRSRLEAANLEAR